MKTLSEVEKTRLLILARDLMNHHFADALFCTRDKWGIPQKHINDWIISHFGYMAARRIHVDYGATRVVVVADNLDWVLKFDFQNAGLSHEYNELEVKNYQYACEWNLEDCFAAMYFLEKVNSIKVYAQERVRIDDDLTSDSFYEYTLQNYYSDEDSDDEDVRENAWEDSNELDNEDRIYAMVDNLTARELVRFTNRYDINDLHSGNWGYRDGDPVLVDYAGY